MESKAVTWFSFQSAVVTEPDYAERIERSKTAEYQYTRLKDICQVSFFVTTYSIYLKTLHSNFWVKYTYCHLGDKTF